MSITKIQEQAIRDKVNGVTLDSGMGTVESPCSIAAINLALSGILTDDIPDCMSNVIGKWIVIIQDSMPTAIRNSDEWKQLLPYAAGTGRYKEKARIYIILDWMWKKVLPTLQEVANSKNFGGTWQGMLDKKTAGAARAAYAAAAAANETNRNWANYAVAKAAECAAKAAANADAANAVIRKVHILVDNRLGDAANADAANADAANADAHYAAYAANAAHYAACAAANAAYAAYAAAECRFDLTIWTNFDPCGLLKKLIDARVRLPLYAYEFV